MPIYIWRSLATPNDGKHEWQVKFKNLTSTKLTFSFGIGKDPSVKLNKQMDLGSGKDDWNWELLALACTSQAWVSVNVGGSSKANSQNVNQNSAQNKNENSQFSFQGRMNWYNAKEKCASIGMRLPTLEEGKAALQAGLTKKWDVGSYWTSDDYFADNTYAHYFNVLNYNIGETAKTVGYLVSCIR